MRQSPEGILAGAAAMVLIGNVAGLIAFWRFVFDRFWPGDRAFPAFPALGSAIVIALVVASFRRAKHRVLAGSLALLVALWVSVWEVKAVRTMIALQAIRDVVSDVCRSGAPARREDIARAAGVSPGFEFEFRCHEGGRFEVSAPAYGRPPLALFPAIWVYDFEARRFYLGD